MTDSRQKEISKAANQSHHVTETASSSEPLPTDWQAYAKRHYKWNHFWGLLSSTAAMGTVSSVTSAFIRDVVKKETDSAFLIANVNTFAAIMASLLYVVQYGSQLLVANPLETRAKKMPSFVVLAVIACSFLATWPVISYFFIHTAPVPSLAVFCILYLGFWFSMGCISVPMTDMFGKAIPIEKRNGFFGNRFALSCVIGFGVGTLIARILNPQKTPDIFRHGYTYLYLAGLGIVVFNYIAFYLMKEPIHAVRKEKKALWPFLVDSFRTTIIKDKNYRAFAAMRILQMFGGLATSLGVLYLTEELSQPLSAHGRTVQWTQVANLITFFAFGRLGNLVGSKVLLQVSSIFGTLASFGFALIPFAARKLQPAFSGWELSSITLGLYIFVNILAQINYTSSTIGRTNYPIDIAPATLRPTYIGFAVTMLVPFVIMQSLGGVIADHSSRQIVYVICGVFYFISLIPSFWMQNVTRQKKRET